MRAYVGNLKPLASEHSATVPTDRDPARSPPGNRMKRPISKLFFWGGIAQRPRDSDRVIRRERGRHSQEQDP